MERREAIKVLNDISKSYLLTIPKKEAINMAIEALESKPHSLSDDRYAEGYRDGCSTAEEYIKANTQLKKQIEMLKLDRECENPSDLIRQMKSEIADSLEFWDYSPNNNPLARDILETVNTYCAKMVEEQGENNGKV